jgi:hypothetical protein
LEAQTPIPFKFTETGSAPAAAKVTLPVKALLILENDGENSIVIAFDVSPEARVKDWQFDAQEKPVPETLVGVAGETIKLLMAPCVTRPFVSNKTPTIPKIRNEKKFSFSPIFIIGLYHNWIGKEKPCLKRQGVTLH